MLETALQNRGLKQVIDLGHNMQFDGAPFPQAGILDGKQFHFVQLESGFNGDNPLVDQAQ